jgi:hypothetical protein
MLCGADQQYPYVLLLVKFLYSVTIIVMYISIASIICYGVLLSDAVSILFLYAK